MTPACFVFHFVGGKDGLWVFMCNMQNLFHLGVILFELFSFWLANTLSAIIKCTSDLINMLSILLSLLRFPPFFFTLAFVKDQ